MQEVWGMSNYLSDKVYEHGVHEYSSVLPKQVLSCVCLRRRMNPFFPWPDFLPRKLCWPLCWDTDLLIIPHMSSVCTKSRARILGSWDVPLTVLQMYNLVLGTSLACASFSLPQSLPKIPKGTGDPLLFLGTGTMCNELGLWSFTILHIRYFIICCQVLVEKSWDFGLRHVFDMSFSSL